MCSPASTPTLTDMANLYEGKLLHFFFTRCFGAAHGSSPRYSQILLRPWLWHSTHYAGELGDVRNFPPAVITRSTSVAVWKRNDWLILFVVGCLVTNVVLWMRRECAILCLGIVLPYDDRFPAPQ